LPTRTRKRAFFLKHQQRGEAPFAVPTTSSVQGNGSIDRAAKNDDAPFALVEKSNFDLVFENCVVDLVVVRIRTDLYKSKIK
jgi:hypothetical protein